MGCNCKTSDKNYIDTTLDGQESVENKISIPRQITIYTVKSIGFLFAIALLPIINIMIVWIMFKTLVLSKDIDVGSAFESLFKKKYKLVKSDEIDEEEDEDDNELTEDDVIPLNVEDITHKMK